MRFDRPALTMAQLVLLAGAVGLGCLTIGIDHWLAWQLFIIALFSVGSELLATRLDAASIASGSHLGIVLAAVLYGPGPAAALGVGVIAAGWVRTRETSSHLRGNLLVCAWFPLLAALVFHGLAAGVTRHDSVFYLCVLAAYLTALGVNVVGVAAILGPRSGPLAILRRAVTMVRPGLAAELASGVLTVGAVWLVVRLHTVGLVMFGIVFVIFQYLLGELLTSRRRGERLRTIATTDELTGLGNRERFRHAIEERIAAAGETGSRFAVLLMDLDRFKEINDTLGHAYGDRLLRDLGPRLQSAIGDRGLVARLGGDEFGILPGEAGVEISTLERIVGGLIRAVAEPFQVDELALEVGASIGVARFPQDGEDSHALLRCADIAMYAAKGAQTDFEIYAADQNRHSMRRLSVLSDIRRALAGEEIVVHYQPIVDLTSRQVLAAEGLVRWEHPEHGLIPPGAFVGTVEQSGLIGPLTRHVLRSAIAQCAGWRSGGRDMSVAVNLSVRNLLDRDLPREIERMLAEQGVPAGALQLEITESMIMTDPDRALATMSRLSDLGVRLSVDDFGTGYSSLAKLRRLPINELKIDRSFVSPMLQDESDLIIVRSTINLGHDLGLRTIAEGVEDAATLERLATLGCDLAQGYHLSRPMAATAFNAWLADTPAGIGAAPAGTPPTPPLSTGWTTTTSGLVVAAPEV